MKREIITTNCSCLPSDTTGASWDPQLLNCPSFGHCHYVNILFSSCAVEIKY